ncbi:substrate-binding domain-containing protein [Hymenobacter profundi]|uniref:Substrate-binding domain-containing protein n=1 Tax=Hymenobacter profundi TaxID=1982110 RepID=A0ABS6WVP9_9BACT|nr:substrate-binding domain-containing protein [Hymenobacter profundi]
MLESPRRFLLLLISSLSLSLLAHGQPLHVYGPGGPAEPMKACAAAFTKQTGVAVDVTAGPEAQWLEKALQDADVVYGGA